MITNRNKPLSTRYLCFAQVSLFCHGFSIVCEQCVAGLTTYARCNMSLLFCQFFLILHKILMRIAVQDSLAFFLNVKNRRWHSYTFHTNNRKNLSFNPIKLKLIRLIVTRMYYIPQCSVTTLNDSCSYQANILITF